jgi:hypothetical protein
MKWEGMQEFKIAGSGLHEDTLRVESNYQKQENMLKLVLPTLCITYADMKFQNAVGGEQANYPDSQVYGGRYFDPPVVLTGRSEIERLTYIRGASKVEIGPKQTIIQFPSWNTLIIPRLRIAKEKPATATIHIPQTSINVDKPLSVKVLQYADGRHVGGVNVEKRHTEWKPPVKEKTYDLWIRVVEGNTLKPIPKSKVNILHWDPEFKTAYGKGGFRLDAQEYTDRNGSIHQPKRPSDELEAFTVNLPGYRITPRCIRPLAGQRVRLHMKAWRLKENQTEFVWKKEETINSLAKLTGHSANEIRKINNLDKERVGSGQKIKLLCYAASYKIEAGDNLDQIGRLFGYKDAKGLLKVNGISDVAKFDYGVALNLPDWYFFYARKTDTLDGLDSLFDLPKGSSTMVGKVFHPNNKLPYLNEIIAIPNKRFAKTLKKRREI